MVALCLILYFCININRDDYNCSRMRALLSSSRTANRDANRALLERSFLSFIEFGIENFSWLNAVETFASGSLLFFENKFLMGYYSFSIQLH